MCTGRATRNGCARTLFGSQCALEGLQVMGVPEHYVDHNVLWNGYKEWVCENIVWITMCSGRATSNGCARTLCGSQCALEGLQGMGVREHCVDHNVHWKGYKEWVCENIVWITMCSGRATSNGCARTLCGSQCALEGLHGMGVREHCVDHNVHWKGYKEWVCENIVWITMCSGRATSNGCARTLCGSQCALEGLQVMGVPEHCVDHNVLWKGYKEWVCENIVWITMCTGRATSNGCARTLCGSQCALEGLQVMGVPEHCVDHNVLWKGYKEWVCENIVWITMCTGRVTRNGCAGTLCGSQCALEGLQVMGVREHCVDHNVLWKGYK